MTVLDGKTLATAAAILLCSSWTAMGCERAIELDSDQVRHQIDLLKAEDADPIDQTDALSALMCAERASVRDLAARTALASPNDSLQAATLAEVLMQKQTIMIEFIEEEGIANDVRDYITENIALSYEVRSVDRNASCIALSNGGCQGYFLDITGKNVDIKYSRDIGSFSLDPEGDLRGYYKPNGFPAKVPARIKLL
ncbi:MAG: hypothetical protein AAGA21_22080 [Pseudomonadota bacterium]